MSSTQTPNMNLIIPTAGSQPGPTFAFDINTSLTLVDQHDHTTGKGVPLTPASLNINSSLDFSNNFADAVAGITFQAQNSTPSATGTLYQSSNDIYFVDGVGNNVRLTQSGAVAGSPGSIGNLTAPASVTYVSADKTYVFQSNTSIAGNLDVGSIILRNTSPNSTFGISLQPPAALSSNYDIVLPSLPASTLPLKITSSGTISSTQIVTADITLLNITTALLAAGSVTLAKMATDSVGTSQIVDGAVTDAKRAALNENVSSSSGSFSTTSTSFQSVTNLSRVITTVGRPVFIGLISDNNGGNAALGARQNNTDITGMLMRFTRDGTEISRMTLEMQAQAGSGTTDPITRVPVSSAWMIDSDTIGVPGTYTYQFQIRASLTGDTAECTNARLIVYEL